LRRIGDRYVVSTARTLTLTFAGAGVAVATFFLERAILGFTDPVADAGAPANATSTFAMLAWFFLMAPLEEAAKVLVVWPTVATRRLDTPIAGVAFAVCAASGFAAAETALIVGTNPLSLLQVLRAIAGVPAHAFCAGLWGFALGARVRSRSRAFVPTVVFATLLHGLYDNIVFGRGPGVLVIALPLLAAMAFVAASALRDLAPHDPADVGPRSLPIHLPEPPSLKSVRRALQRSDQPLFVRWILFGAIVNVGVVVVSVFAAVLVAKRLGIDLSLADEGDMRSNGPVVLLGLAVLAAFPFAGYLVARASGTEAVLEPALAAGLAIGGAVALLSLTAPSAVIFAIAIAPVAFGLACGGAWFGMDS
jgi:hypothetical protein